MAGGTNIGKFHLACNLAGTESVHDSFAGQDGTIFGHDYAGVFGLYPMLGV